MTTPLDRAREHAVQHYENAVELMRRFCAIPSISTLPEHESDMTRAAEWLIEQLLALGMDQASVLPTGGHPVVYAEWLGAPGKPTVLIYGHYDVQPVDPIEEWDTDPFIPTIRREDMVARGASDMKGQLAACLAALEALRAAHGTYPINLKFLIEGEEEIGSPNLGAFIQAEADRLGCDFVLNCDSGIYGVDQPSITYGLRGLAYFDLEVRGPQSDLHSGIFGGAVHNPLQALCELIAGMHDADGRITLPGFYDAVLPLEANERDVLARGKTMDEAEWKRLSGAPAAWGESDYTILERIGARPTLEVNGLIGGFTGEGAKTVLPAKAQAKISMRLVPHQTSDAVADQLRAYLEAHAPSTVTWELLQLAGAPAAITRRNSPPMKAAARALEAVFGVEPAWRRDGGTVPVVGLLKELLGVDTVLLGFELPDAGFHGPNEKMHLPTFKRAIETYIRFLNDLE